MCGRELDRFAGLGVPDMMCLDVSDVQGAESQRGVKAPLARLSLMMSVKVEGFCFFKCGC